MNFIPFPKLSRLNRNIVITEKLDGTNAQIYIHENGEIQAGSRKRWITVNDDNYGFANWVDFNKDELREKLGPGQHFGEWWGQGIQRKYGLDEKRFSLFNTHRWSDNDVRPKCCHVVPIIYTGLFSEIAIQQSIDLLNHSGSIAAPGFKKAEGIVIFHTAANHMFKVTCVNDEKPKSQISGIRL